MIATDGEAVEPPTVKYCRKRRREMEASISLSVGIAAKVAVMLFLLCAPTEARTFHFFSYTTMMGLAAQSTHWKLQMEGELTKAAETSAEATAWQQAAANDQATADELTEKSIAEEEKAAALQEEADGLRAKGESDQSRAATTEEEAQGMAGRASENESQSAALLAQAAAEQVVAEEDSARGTADAVLAARDTAEAEVDEATTAICQVVPVADVVCDLVGGAAAIALESQSVRYAARAAEKFAAAVVAEAEADSAAAEATELQAAAAAEGEEAGALQSEAAALEAKATEELELAEVDEGAAEREVAESTADETAASEEQAKALTEEEAFAKMWQESLHHGANACGNALMMSAVSAVSFFFWMVRIGGSILVPMLKSSYRFLWAVARASGEADNNMLFGTPAPDILMGISHVFQHCLIFVLSFGLWGFALVRFRKMTLIKSMGGAVLGFSATAAATESLMVHSALKIFQHEGSLMSCLWVGSFEFVRRMLIIWPLVIMEVLLVWVNAGSWAFTPRVIQLAQSYWLWGLLVISLATHHACFVGRSEKREAEEGLVWGQVRHYTRAGEVSKPLVVKNIAEYGAIDISVAGIYDDADAGDHLESIESKSDSVGLLRNDAVSVHGNSDRCTDLEEKDRGLLSVLMEDFRRFRLLLVFEVLMASIILALLLQSAPMLLRLWPASNAILLAAHPQWRLFAALIAAAAFILLLCAFV